MLTTLARKPIEKPMTSPTDKYKHCNHHHELTDDQQIVDFGSGPFVADKRFIPLLREMNKLGLVTRTHNYAEDQASFLSILISGVSVEIRDVDEKDADRTLFDGEKEMLLVWTVPKCDGS